MALTPRSVFRYFNVDGVPASGNHRPEKAEIIQLLDQMQGASGVPAVVKKTKAELDLVVPASENYGGTVLDDPDPAKSGFYYRDSGAWVWARSFPDTVAVLNITGGTADAVEASSRPGISPGNVLIFLVQPIQTNTGSVSLALNGGAELPVRDVNGNDLAPGLWTSGRLIQLLQNGDEYRLLSDPDADGAAQAAAASAVTAQFWAELAGEAALPAGSVTLSKLSAALAATVPMLTKSNSLSSAVMKTGVGTASVRAGTVVKVGNVLVGFDTDTAITMPALVAGSDYAVFISDAGVAQAVAWTENTGINPSPPTGNWTWIGGFHYAPGGNATGYNTGGNRTPEINQHSCWDLRFRPKCRDPRGMALMANKFWFDIYFLGVDHHLAGTSRHGVNIATGDVKPKLPVMFGGDGTTLVTQLDWFWAYEILDSHEKRMMHHNEFRSAAFGVIEQAAGGRAVPAVKTGINFDNNGDGTNNDERYTSMWGMNLAIANHYVWGQEFVGHTYNGDYTSSTPQTAPQIAPFYYRDHTGRDRGYSPQLGLPYIRAALYGGSFGSNTIGRSGSGSMDWANSINSSSPSISVRGAADHLII